MTPIFSTAYLPSIDYLFAISRCREVFIEAKETFPKQTYRNRAIIATAGGRRPLIIPVMRTHGNHTMTDQITISYKEHWNIIHLRTLEAAYAASPYWMYYKDGLEKIMLQHYEKLIDLNIDLLHWMLKTLKIDCHIKLTTDYIALNNEEWDYRYLFSPKHKSPFSTFEKYYQVFDAQFGFMPNLSALDLMMNLGPESRGYLNSIS